MSLLACLQHQPNVNAWNLSSKCFTDLNHAQQLLFGHFDPCIYFYRISFLRFHFYCTTVARGQRWVCGSRMQRSRRPGRCWIWSRSPQGDTLQVYDRVSGSRCHWLLAEQKGLTAEDRETILLHGAAGSGITASASFPQLLSGSNSLTSFIHF